jgi:hypothetical protein
MEAIKQFRDERDITIDPTDLLTINEYFEQIKLKE